jgi:hypothetical protein
MRSLYLATAALLGLSAVQALAQVPVDPSTGARPGHEAGVGESLPRSTQASNIDTADTRSAIAPTLPGSGLGPDAAAHDYLKSARDALAAGRTGQAQQSLEMAETRALDRSVAQGQGSTPSDSQFVSQIREALHALGHGDTGHALQLIDTALAT